MSPRFASKTILGIIPDPGALNPCVLHLSVQAQAQGIAAFGAEGLRFEALRFGRGSFGSGSLAGLFVWE